LKILSANNSANIKFLSFYNEERCIREFALNLASLENTQMKKGNRAPSKRLSLSTNFKLEKGLRQGCPMSPSLFSILIDDLADELRDLGVTIPGLEDKWPCLKFADDVVCLCESAGDAKEALRRVEAWGTTNGMRIGAVMNPF